MQSILQIICEEVTTNVIGTRGVTLVGSKARGEKNVVHDEYDIVVEIPTALVPFILVKLKKLEQDLAGRLGISLSLNPIPTYRVTVPKNNVLYHEINDLGITLCGCDLPSRLNLNIGFSDIPKTEAITYLFNAALNLLEIFKSKYVYESPLKSEVKEIEYISLKTISQCCDSVLLFYKSYKPKLLDRVHFISNPKLKKVIQDECNFPLSDLIRFARVFINFKETNKHNLSLSPIDIWFQAKIFLEETFRFLFSKIFRFERSISELGARHLELSTCNYINNTQFLIADFLLKRKIKLKFFFSKISPCTRYQIALLHLLSALDRSSIDERRLNHATSILFLNDKMKSKNTPKKWNLLKKEICEGWTLSCTTLI